MRILVTGSSGQLGIAIAEHLSTDHEPIGLDLTPGKWTQHVISTVNRDAVFQVMKGIDAVIHTASLHQPHLTTHSRQSFIDTNITGTLNVLEAAVRANVQHFVYTSTTSLYGSAMVPVEKAVWVTEDIVPRPRDIYDITKITAEELCQDVALTTGMPTICLRVSRFFAQTPEIQALHRLYRGVDVRDVIAAHALAVTNKNIAFDIFNISARTPFLKEDLPMLLNDAITVFQKRVPYVIETFTRYGWTLPKTVDRVYVIEKAERILGYQPIYGFKEYVQELDQHGL